MRLNELRDNDGGKRPRKRIGRGIGSGTGKTSGKGHKGQKARSGGASRYFEGGQMPIYRRLPKRGFKNPNRAVFSVINLDTLQRAVDAGKIDVAQTVDVESLVKAGVLRRSLDGVRVMARGEITVALTIEAAGASQKAIEAIAAAGGKLTVLGGPGKSEEKTEGEG